MRPAPEQLIRQLEMRMCTKRLTRRIAKPTRRLNQFSAPDEKSTNPNSEIPMIKMASDSQFSEMVLYRSVVIFFDRLCMFGRVYREQMIPQNRIDTIPENSRLCS